MGNEMRAPDPDFLKDVRAIAKHLKKGDTVSIWGDRLAIFPKNEDFTQVTKHFPQSQLKELKAKFKLKYSSGQNATFPHYPLTERRTK